jgi:hypothetical protein
MPSAQTNYEQGKYRFMGFQIFMGSDRTVTER